MKCKNCSGAIERKRLTYGLCEVCRDSYEASLESYMSLMRTIVPPKDKTLCSNGHSRVNNVDKWDHCLGCIKDRAISIKRKTLGSGSIWY